MCSRLTRKSIKYNTESTKRYYKKGQKSKDDSRPQFIRKPHRYLIEDETPNDMF